MVGEHVNESNGENSFGLFIYFIYILFIRNIRSYILRQVLEEIKRGRRHLSFWKIIKESLFPRNNKDIYICNTNKLLAIDQFCVKFHQEDSEHPRKSENIQMKDDQEIDFELNDQLLNLAGAKLGSAFA